MIRQAYSTLTCIRYFLFLLIATPALLTSCEKVIDLDLNTAEKKYVIEGFITDQPGTSIVRISQTKNFDEDNTFIGISGATITVRENGGAATPFSETSPGAYEASALVGTSGKEYTLSVNVGGKFFSATSTMPQKINLDSIYITDELIFTDTRKIVNAVIEDPAGLGNNYRFVQYVNNIKENQVLIRNDEYSDGRRIVNKLFYFAEDEDSTRKIETGDEVKIDMQCIDRNIYKYWFSLDRSATGGSGQATPSNPVSNIQGGALGYFSAHTLQTKTMVVP
jgi:Domain of unknown function (DUF4249)